jgi:archaellum component FlaC
MTPQTETELVALIQNLAQKIDDAREEMRSEFASVREEMRVGFAKVEGKIDVLTTRLTEVENKVGKLDTKLDKQDNRLWAFVAIVLSAALGTIWKILN